MDTNFWEGVRVGFTQLRADCAINPPTLTAGRLVAVWAAQPEPGVWRWRLEHWNKKDGNGVTERFKWLAQSAAARLGFAGRDDDSVSFWLDQIKRDAPESHLREFFEEGDESNQLYAVEILDICGLSADYCRKCEADETVKRTRAQEIMNEAPTHLPELPPKFQNAFEAAKAKAELEYATRAERFPQHSEQFELIQRLKLPQDVFFAYCIEARNACRAGSMTVAQARKATDAALPFFCDFYFVRRHGDCSAEAKSTSRVNSARVITDDPKWKQHLTELVALAEDPSNASLRRLGKGKGPSAARSLGLSRKGDPALLAGKDLVTFKTAEEYLGISERQRQSLMEKGSLVVKGKGLNRRITTESLLEYLPTENPK